MIKISIHTERQYRHRFDGIFQVRNLLRDAGYRIEFSEKISGRNKTDVAWIQGSLLKECPEDSQPKICYERFASGTIEDVENLSRNDVSLYTKEICYRSRSTYLRALINNRVHTALLYTKDDGRAKPNSLLTPSSLTKVDAIHAIYRQEKRFGAYFSRKHQKPSSIPAHKRRIDVFFSGNIDFKDSGGEIAGKLITDHRKSLARILSSELSQDMVILLGLGRCFSPDDFRSQLVNSKIFVSPYGWGEYSWKDFEAVISGCILIKPECSFLKSYGPRLYQEGVIECRPDFSDLKDIVARTLDNLEEESQKAQLMREEFVKARFDNESYAKDVAGVLSTALSAPSDYQPENRLRWVWNALRKPLLPS